MGLEIPPLCIIQARYHSTRLPGKMLLPLGGETLIARAWRIACEAFGAERCVVAIAATDFMGPLWDELQRIGARQIPVPVAVDDVLYRFWTVAMHLGHTGVIHRWTPDDPFKQPTLCREAVRLVEIGSRDTIMVEQAGEAFTFKQLCEAQACTPANHEWREHLGNNPWLFPHGPTPSIGAPGFTIDTPEDYEAAKARVNAER